MISQVIFLSAFACLAAASGIVVPVAHHAPQPYKFGYDIKDKHSEQYRQESGNGAGGVAGSYGFTDARGVKRQVDYVADHAGFRAAVKTNEPGTANQNPAAVQMVSAAPYAGGVAAVGGVGLGYGGALNGRLGYGLGYGNLGGVLDGRAGLLDGRAGLLDGRADLLDGRAGLLDGRAGLLDGRAGLLDGRLGVLDGRAGLLDGRAGLLDGRAGLLDGRLGVLDGRLGGYGLGYGILGGLGYARYGY